MSDNNDAPMAVIKEINGQIVLDDPQAIAIINVMNKKNCENSLVLNLDRIKHFKQRMVELKKTPQEVVVVIISVDDVNGEEIAEALMPNQNWQEFRDKGEKPFARGLADRKFMQEILEVIDKETAQKAKTIIGTMVIVVDFGVVEVYEV